MFSIVFLLLYTIAPSLAEHPAALEAIARERNKWENGEVHFVWTSPLFKGADRRLTAQFGGPDNVLVNRGDEQGVLFRGPSGEPLPFSKDSPLISLDRDEQSWNYSAGDTRALVRTGRPLHGGGVVNVRSLGLGYRISYSDVATTLRIGRSPDAEYRFSSTENGATTIVTATSAGKVITWELDHAQGGLPTRVILERDGEIVEESRSRLRQWNGIWYPELVEFFRRDQHEGKEAYESVLVTSAVFDSPKLPKRIEPESIGIDAGVFVELRDPKSNAVEGRFWDGAALITIEEQRKRNAKGEWKVGPIYSANSARRQADGNVQPTSQPAAAKGTAEAKTADSEWEAYTRRFIIIYALNDSQTQKALSVLDQCKEAARTQMSSHETELREIDERLGKIKELPAKDRELPQRTLLEKQKKLLEPLEKIFESKLKPALDAIPTRAQREKATGRKDEEKRPK